MQEPLGFELPKDIADQAVLLGQPESWPRPEELTFIDLTGLAFTKAGAYLEESQTPAAKREYALAKTHLEDAILRFNRARSMDLGIFNVTDTEDPQFLQMITNITEQTEGGEST